MFARSRLVRAGRPGVGASKWTSIISSTSAGEPGWSRPAVVFSALVDGHGRLASGPRADEVVAAHVSGAWAYLRHAAVAGDMKPCGHDRRELTHVGDRTGGGSCRFFELPGGRGPISCGVGEAADLAVAQAVVDEGQQVAGGGDTRPMLRPRRAPMRAFTEAICGSRAAPETASTAAQRNSREPCLGDPAAVDVGVGLAVAWGQPGP